MEKVLAKLVGRRIQLHFRIETGIPPMGGNLQELSPDEGTGAIIVQIPPEQRQRNPAAPEQGLFHFKVKEVVGVFEELSIAVPSAPLIRT